MINQKKFLVFNEGKQKEFLVDVKSKLNCTWKRIISYSKVSRSMFYNYLKEKHILNEHVFTLLIKKAKIDKSQYTFKVIIKKYNDAEIPNKNKEDFAEFIGVILGDGHISKAKFQIVITLNSVLELDYLNNKIKILLSKLFNINPQVRNFKNKNAVQIYFTSKKVSEFLTQQIGLPYKRRTNNPKNIIPSYLFKNKKLLDACLRGLSDTEGSLSVRHHKAIRLSIYNNCNYLLNSIYKALKTLNYNPIRKKRSIRLNRTSEIIRFFNEIGSSNYYKLKRYTTWTKTGKLPNVSTAVL